LFTDLLPPEEKPVRSSPDVPWARLPADPRLPDERPLRIVPRDN